MTSVDSSFADSRTQDRSRKNKHNSKGKGKGRGGKDSYGAAGEGKSLTYNVPQLGGDRTSQGDYYPNYSHYGPSSGQPYRTSSYAGQSDYGGQGGNAPSQGQSRSVELSGIGTYLSVHKLHDSTPVPLAQHPLLLRETSPICPLKPLPAARMGTSNLSPEACTSKEVEVEGRRQVVSEHYE